ncbi:MAG: MarR family transcriptional regulator [Terrisporobacter sp.]|uniref:MarR family winged helix-turn-helix transcriptional regulator n=1 Tax=Terrisporobacter sp. TaxID=1965305 RepID=UPI002F93EEE1
MEKKEFIYMMEKMNEVRLFSRSLIIHSTIKNKRTAQEYDLLSQLVLHNEGMTPANLSKAMYLNKTIVSRLVDKLNKDGYVTKKQDEYDKRSYSVFITEYGKEELFKIYELYLSPINELRLKLGDEEFFNLISCIEKANKIMNKE